MAGILLLASCNRQKNTARPKAITALTEVFGDGQKVTVVVIEYDKAIKNETLSTNQFSVANRTITKIYANDSNDKSDKGKNGKFVVLELNPKDETASIYKQQGREIIIKEAKVSVKQLLDVVTIDNQKIDTNDELLESSQVKNLIVDDFKQAIFTDSKTGIKLNYNLYIPKNYDKNKSYPLVLFMHDAGVTSTEPKTTLIQGNGATIWASPTEQAKHECFVLAPQFEVQIVNDKSEATEHLDATINLINQLQQDYKVDKNRIYTTGQSGGCMMSIAMNIKYPDLFAASYLVAGQWDVSKVLPLTKDNLWIVVAEGDAKAFPGMNAITKTLEENGAMVSRATWSGRATEKEFSELVAKMETENSNINYVVLQKGTVVPEGQTDNAGANHVNTWKIAYNIEGIRDWLFRQKK